jgi:hypothetical protein
MWKVIVSLREAVRLMGEVDGVIDVHGGGGRFAIEMTYPR